jgi:peptide/nickel transport system ATP-binding protein
MLLEIKNLTTKFDTKNGPVTVVNNVSFSINTGEILAIVGESGSGKSLVSLSVIGLVQSPGKVTDGEVIFKGENLLQKTSREMLRIRGKEISMIFQEPMTSLNPMYRIGDQIMECIRIHYKKMSKSEAREKMLHMLRLVHIPEPERRALDYPHQISGGMRQRVMIAMAMSCAPSLLIADEPTTALDVTIQAQILDMLYRMRDEFHNSVLLITHDMGVVSEAADRVVVMYCGRILEEAKTADILETPLHPYTVGLIKSLLDVDTEVQDRLYMIRGMVPSLAYLPPGCAFFNRCEQRMERCKSALPPLYSRGERKVRCFLYDRESLHG